MLTLDPVLLTFALLLSGFGVAPAMLLYFWSLHELKGVGWLAAMLFAIACALRLARFNVMIDDPNKPAWMSHFFVGMPSPAGAIVVMLPLYLHLSVLELPATKTMAAVSIVYVLAIAFLMASRIPHFSGKRIGRIPRDLVIPVLFGVGVAGSVVELLLLTLAASSSAAAAVRCARRAEWRPRGRRLQHDDPHHPQLAQADRFPGHRRRAAMQRQQAGVELDRAVLRDVAQFLRHELGDEGHDAYIGVRGLHRLDRRHPYQGNVEAHVLARLRDLHDRVDTLVGIVDKLSTNSGIRIVKESGSHTGAALDDHGEAFAELGDDFRHEGDATLARDFELRMMPDACTGSIRYSVC